MNRFFFLRNGFSMFNEFQNTNKPHHNFSLPLNQPAF
jgi:hypothetical protein